MSKLYALQHEIVHLLRMSHVYGNGTTEYLVELKYYLRGDSKIDRVLI